jgi:hypothetical protein
LPTSMNPLLILLLNRSTASLPLDRMRPRSSLRRWSRPARLWPGFLRLFDCGFAAFRAALRSACFWRRASRAWTKRTKINSANIDLRYDTKEHSPY